MTTAQLLAKLTEAVQASEEGRAAGKYNGADSLVGEVFVYAEMLCFTLLQTPSEQMHETLARHEYAARGKYNAETEPRRCAVLSGMVGAYSESLASLERSMDAERSTP